MFCYLLLSAVFSCWSIIGWLCGKNFPEGYFLIYLCRQWVHFYFLVAQLLYDLMYVCLSVRNAIGKMWFSRLQLRIDCWNFQLRFIEESLRFFVCLSLTFFSLLWELNICSETHLVCLSIPWFVCASLLIDVVILVSKISFCVSTSMCQFY